jgi:hypothetical protein
MRLLRLRHDRELQGRLFLIALLVLADCARIASKRSGEASPP